MFTNTISGGGVYVEPTTTQKQQDEVRLANEKMALRAAKIERELASKRRARDEATAQANAPETRFQALLLGTTRFASKSKRAGDTAKAEKLQVLADQMATALDDFRTAKKAEAVPVKTPLQDAVQAAAKELRKAFPACFPSMADAEEYAGRNLPLTDARTAQVKADDERGRLCKAVQTAAARFWSLAESAAKTATGKNDDTAIHDIECAGSL